MKILAMFNSCLLLCD